MLLSLLLATGSGDADSELALKLNPSNRALRRGQTLLVIASSKEHAESINVVSVGDETALDSRASDCSVAPWYSATLDWEMRGISGRSAPPGQRSYSRDAVSPDLMTIPAVGRGDAALALTTHLAASAEGSPHMGAKDPDLDLMDHVIVSGCPDSFVEFVRTLRAVWGGGSGESSSSPTLVVLHPSLDPGGRDADLVAELREVAGGAERVRLVRGSPSEASALERASASRARCARACSTEIGLFTNVLYDDISLSKFLFSLTIDRRCLVYLASTQRPPGSTSSKSSSSASSTTLDDGVDHGGATRASVMADAEALQACYRCAARNV